MQYALLIYGRPGPVPAAHPVEGAIAAVLAGPSVSGWARLHAEESAATVRGDQGRILLTD